MTGNRFRTRAGRVTSITGFAAGAALLAATAAAVAAERADRVLQGAVYTMDPDQPRAEAVAVRDGRIVAVGSREELAAYIGSRTEVIAPPGAMVLPGFHDAHVHPVTSGLEQIQCPLEGRETQAAVAAKVRECAADKAPGEWVVGAGWLMSLFPDGRPRKAVLDAAAPENPVYLDSADGHTAWVNSRALEAAGIDADTPDPPNGFIDRDPATGEPRGGLWETAQKLVERILPPVTLERRAEALRVALDMANRHGVTSMIDAAVGETHLEPYRFLERRGELTARVVTSVEYGTNIVADTQDFDALIDRRDEYRGERLRPDAVKLFVDGILEGETAALLEPYRVTEPHRGQLMFEPGALAGAVTRLDAAGLQVHMHAIGDRAVRVALDALAAARRVNGPGDNRHHVAHLQLVHPRDIPRFAELDVTANFQALWAYPDEYITDLNLPVVGRERVERMYPIASMRRAGARIVGGSDWSVSSIDPLLAMEVAVTRRDPSGKLEGVLNAGERVDLQTMLEAYTINGAWLMHQEQETGSIEVGKAADLVVLEHDIFEVAPGEIGAVAVLYTFLEGDPVYTAGGGGSEP